MALRDTAQFQTLQAAFETLKAMDHEPEQDPDELIPRYFESAMTLNGLSYVREWDLPDDVRQAVDRVMAWLGEEHAGHVALLDRGHFF